MPWAWLLIALVALQRLAELVLARRNTRRLLAQGAVERGAGHYPFFIALHAAWFVAMVVVIPPDRIPDTPLFVLFLMLQAGRVWVLATLGGYWTTRVIHVPNARLIRSGPFRFLRHPNYTIVLAELFVLPASLGAWWLGLVFVALKLPLLWVRLRVEEGGLATRRASVQS